jgi:hypothetical protein
MEESLMDSPLIPQTELPSHPTSEVMKLLITDLRELRTKENYIHVDKIIKAAQFNYFDDIKNPRVGVPTVELIMIAQQCQLPEIATNTKAGKYDVQSKRTEQYTVFFSTHKKYIYSHLINRAVFLATLIHMICVRCYTVLCVASVLEIVHIEKNERCSNHTLHHRGQY